MDLQELTAEFQRRFDRKMQAREGALAASRRAIRSSANAIRAVHRGELEEAGRLMDEARAALDEGATSAADHPDVLFGGFVQDAQKEYAEARITEALVTDARIPGPDELEVSLAPYLNGMAEAIGEARRRILDLLRQDEVDRAEALLGAAEDLYHVLVSMDYPDGLTGNLRRSTDIARGIMEKTRGDLTSALVQRNLKEALERHVERFLDEPPPSR